MTDAVAAALEASIDTKGRSDTPVAQPDAVAPVTPKKKKAAKDQEVPGAPKKKKVRYYVRCIECHGLHFIDV